MAKPWAIEKIEELLDATSQGSGSKTLLELWWSTISTPEEGSLNISIDNGLLLRASFPDAWAKIEASGEAISDANWVNEKNANGGVCGKYSLGNGTTTFRVPLIPKRFVRAAGLGLQAGDVQGDAIRNITGNLADNFMSATPQYLTGAFKLGTSRSPYILGAVGSSLGGEAIFDASLVVPTAEENRPLTVAYTPMLHMYGSLTDAGSANVAALIQATTGKLDTSRFETSQQIMHVRDEKPTGTAAGTFTAGAWRTRDLNTVKTNTIPGASLANNQITLPAGTYDILAGAAAVQTSGNTAQIVTSTGQTLLVGINSYARVDNSAFCLAPVSGRIILSQTTILELQHRSISTGYLGNANSIAGIPEIYAEVFIRRIA